jgi:hypothetical protein
VRRRRSAVNPNPVTIGDYLFYSVAEIGHGFEGRHEECLKPRPSLSHVRVVLYVVVSEKTAKVAQVVVDKNRRKKILDQFSIAS